MSSRRPPAGETLSSSSLPSSVFNPSEDTSDPTSHRHRHPQRAGHSTSWFRGQWSTRHARAYAIFSSCSTSGTPSSSGNTNSSLNWVSSPSGKPPAEVARKLLDYQKYAQGQEFKYSQCTIQTAVHTKPNIIFQYLHFDSYHLYHAKKKLLPYSLPTRAKIICSTNKHSLTGATPGTSSTNRFSKPSQIPKTQTNVNNSDIPQALETSLLRASSGLSKLRNILHSGYKILASSPQTQDLFSKPSRLVFNRPLTSTTNWKDFLKFFLRTVLILQYGLCQMLYCTLYIPHLRRLQKCNGKYSTLQCQHCNVEYIGLTTNTLWQRMNGHRADTKQAIAGHINNLQDKLVAHAPSYNKDFNSCYSTRVARALPPSCNSSELRRWELANQFITKSSVHALHCISKPRGCCGHMVLRHAQCRQQCPSLHPRREKPLPSGHLYAPPNYCAVLGSAIDIYFRAFPGNHGRIQPGHNSSHQVSVPEGAETHPAVHLPKWEDEPSSQAGDLSWHPEPQPLTATQQPPLQEERAHNHPPVPGGPKLATAGDKNPAPASQPTREQQVLRHKPAWQVSRIILETHVPVHVAIFSARGHEEAGPTTFSQFLYRSTFKERRVQHLIRHSDPLSLPTSPFPEEKGEEAITRSFCLADQHQLHAYRERALLQPPLQVIHSGCTATF
ncbi:hypothetical protein PR048_004156 [Dryococelus australis]|uniref:GIY-YIG domain-containing protein n=1 Tax=Dryococelus australis TaxID=614101 RepID=A0ABQ9I4P2_9NEOP|nr:hypothetical protein PR048_004156 [Dryococelus australis]